jgi:DNA-binding NtrC family response regulator
MDPEDLQRKHVVLVVEDDVLIRFLIGDHLRDVGFNVLEASNVRDAMTLIASQVRIDLVFSDINMPGDMDGCALANWLRVFSPKIPVILTSGAKPPRLIIEPTSRGFIIKPYAVEEAERHIREVLDGPAGSCPATPENP